MFSLIIFFLLMVSLKKEFFILEESVSLILEKENNERKSGNQKEKEGTGDSHCAQLAIKQLQTENLKFGFYWMYVSLSHHFWPYKGWKFIWSDHPTSGRNDIQCISLGCTCSFLHWEVAGHVTVSSLQAATLLFICKISLFLFYMYRCFACMCVCATHVCSAERYQKRSSEPLEL